MLVIFSSIGYSSEMCLTLLFQSPNLLTFRLLYPVTINKPNLWILNEYYIYIYCYRISWNSLQQRADIQFSLTEMGGEMGSNNVLFYSVFVTYIKNLWSSLKGSTVCMILYEQYWKLQNVTYRSSNVRTCLPPVSELLTLSILFHVSQDNMSRKQCRSDIIFVTAVKDIS